METSLRIRVGVSALCIWRIYRRQRRDFASPPGLASPELPSSSACGNARVDVWDEFFVGTVILVGQRAAGGTRLTPRTNTRY